MDSYGGVVQVSWDPFAEVKPSGHMMFFVEFLESAGLFDGCVSDCPLQRNSNSGSSARGVLGTTVHLNLFPEPSLRDAIVGAVN